jgi:hypothetical protein
LHGRARKRRGKQQDGAERLPLGRSMAARCRSRERCRNDAGRAARPEHRASARARRSVSDLREHCRGLQQAHELHLRLSEDATP